VETLLSGCHELMDKRESKHQTVSAANDVQRSAHLYKEAERYNIESRSSASWDVAAPKER
jgi:hypothetical protein